MIIAVSFLLLLAAATGVATGSGFLVSTGAATTTGSGLAKDMISWKLFEEIDSATPVFKSS